ncbi:hypothetical protein [Candidatus Atelocyanobacterium thalassae]|uniref:Glycosyltransferase RgtA/B/C/D-like domain-containing protein n=1 Tax=cyanobacterium endosymbiont of Braarudosphaera bigelowii TaxID=1285375 RepID=A0ABM7U4S0_9CHRO|nr:hypothetical protein [Candidatus Atelocyanobacterium thalassa]BDA39670.1 hypothetical protein CPARK_000050900 [cyanobacterium endosymbiont of Braarudosphaera bigelowii]
MSLKQNKKIEIVLIITFSFITLIGILNHAMWRDELNGWLIARDSSSFFDFFESVKYEGHPLLWYFLLWFLNKITANPIIMQIVHWLISVATISIFIIYSPFNALQKILFSFGYFPLYEYSLISRNYAFGILSIFLFCTYFHNKYKNYIILAFILAFMANTNAYCLLISIALSITLIFEYYFKKHLGYKVEIKKNHIFLSLIILIIGVSISVFTLLPPVDSTLQGGANQWFLNFDINRLLQTVNRIWRSYVMVIIPSDSKILDLIFFSFLSISLFGCILLSFIKKPVALCFFLIGSLEIIIFTYIKFLGSQRHYGHLYIILISSLWIENNYDDEKLYKKYLENISFRFLHIFSKTIEILTSYRKYLIGIILWLQVIAGMVAFSRDLSIPYSSSKMTANFIQQNNLDNYHIFGSEDFTIAPISGYLNKKIYYPETKKMGSYVLFNNSRQATNDLEIIGEIEKYFVGKNKNENVLLILNHSLIEYSVDLDIVLLKKFTKSFIYNEKYYIYLVKSHKND